MAKDRSLVPSHLKWRVEDIFATVEDWNATYAACEGQLDFSEFEGKLGDPEIFLACMERLNELGVKLNKLAVYAHMRHDEDSRNSEFTALQARFSMLGMKLAAATSFITPELTALPVETLEAFAADPRLADYDYTIRCIIKDKPHVLSKEMEALLSQGSRVFGGYQQVFGMLDNADFPYPTVKVDGKPVTVTHGMYGVLLQHPDRRVRKAAFQAYYKSYILQKSFRS